MTTLHLLASVGALASGAMVLVRAKGTSPHRIVGAAYVCATVLYCLSSFAIYPSTGRLTPFHAIALQNLCLVGSGVAVSRVFRRRVPEWRVWHLRLMSYSYVSLVATGLRFAIPALPQSRLIPALTFAVVPVACWVYIERRVVPFWRRQRGPEFGEGEARA